jgi:hypothetical protein
MEEIEVMTMGLYRRRDGRCKNKIWWISYIKGGRQLRESSGSTNKKLAEKLLTLRTAQVFEERWSLPRSKSPRLGDWVEEFLKSVQHDKTRSRYRSSTNNVVGYFGKNVRLPEITVESVFRFQQKRLEQRAVIPST